MVDNLFIFNSKIMKQQNINIIFKVLVLLVLLFIVDRSVGAVFEKLKNIGLERTPNASRTEYTLKKVDAEVLIMGSSRANHHYVTSILSDSLNKTVFNCGLDGQGFDYSVAMIYAVLKRYTPETIIIDINPRMLDNSSSFGNMSELYPYYSKDELFKEMIIHEDPNNRYKMLSQMYKYNSRIISLARRMFLADHNQDDGYHPLPNNGYIFSNLNNVEYISNNEIDDYKEELLLYCIESCKEKNINLILSVSPRYQESNIHQDSSYIHLKKLLEENNTPLIYMGDNTVINDSTLYKDAAHLNHNGAVAFTKAFVGRLKEVI